MKKRIVCLIITVLSFLLCAVPAGFADQENVGELSYEVKFLLDSELVLDGETRLEDQIRSLFHMEGDYKQIDVVYLETPERAFLREGWINRLRQKAGKEKIERTYKKRYPVIHGDIDAALAQAVNDGFGAYDAQIDWGYADMTLSLSVEDSDQHPERKNLSQFTAEDAVRFFEETMPQEERGLSDLFSGAQKVGPVRFLRIKGSWQDIEEVTIEIWPTLHITELSFDIDDYDSAADARDRLMAFLDEEGILLHEDALKTTALLNAGPEQSR